MRYTLHKIVSTFLLLLAGWLTLTCMNFAVICIMVPICLFVAFILSDVAKRESERKYEQVTHTRSMLHALQKSNKTRSEQAQLHDLSRKVFKSLCSYFKLKDANKVLDMAALCFKGNSSFRYNVEEFTFQSILVFGDYDIDTLKCHYTEKQDNDTIFDTCFGMVNRGAAVCAMRSLLGKLDIRNVQAIHELKNLSPEYKNIAKREKAFNKCFFEYPITAFMMVFGDNDLVKEILDKDPLDRPDFLVADRDGAYSVRCMENFAMYLRSKSEDLFVDCVK